MIPVLMNLVKVTFEVFGEMFFLFPDEMGEEALPTVLWHRVSIDIEGSAPYRLTFFFADAMARVMSENYLGEREEAISQPMVVDVLKEAVNVIGGNHLNRLNDDSLLGIPHYHGTTPSLDTPGVELVHDLTIEGERFRVCYGKI